jgi:hypothetical protein
VITDMKKDKYQCSIFFQAKIFLTKHESFMILKVFKVKVVFIFHFDHFLDLGFGTIVDGATGGCSIDKKKFLAKPVMFNSVKTTFEVPGGFR